MDDIDAPINDLSEPQQGDAPAVDSSNLVARSGFPHAKVHKRWEARIKYAKAAYKENERDYREALRDLAGPNKSTAESSGPTRDKKFTSQIFTSDFLKIISFYNNRVPRTVCTAAKGPESKPLADATAMLSDRSAVETGEKEQDALAIAEAICRNHGYVRCGWDPYRWLPTFKYVAGEVMLDPDCAGDVKAARWWVEEAEMPLCDLLYDETIPKAIRDALKEKKEARRKSRTLSEGALTDDDARKEYDAPQDWDAQDDLAKVCVYKIFSREGLLPGLIEGEDLSPERADAEIDAPKADPITGAVPMERHSIHARFAAPPEVPDDAAPEAQPFDPQEHGRRVYILMVAGFDRVLKVTDWPMDHFDRDESPYVECRPILVPGLMHGMTIYRMIRPYMKVINEAIEFWVAAERRGAKRVIELQKDAITDATERAKLESDNMLEVVEVDQRGGVGVVDFQGRSYSFKEMIPFFLEMHDNTTGINEAVSGRAPDVEETASAAQMRQDQAVAALAYLENAVQSYHERKARMRVAALQRYVPKHTEYAPCDTCFGLMALEIEGEMHVCPTCGGTGQGRILKKGADFWLPPEQAEAWRDDLSLDEIRAEVIVGVQPGSSRADYTERRLAMLTTIADRYIPTFMQMGLYNRAQSIMREHLRATEVPGADEFVPTVEEIAQAQQAMMQAQAAANQKPGKSPEEIQMEMQAQQHEQRMAEGELQVKYAQGQGQIRAQMAMAEVQRINAELQLLAARERIDAEMRKAKTPPPVDPVKVEEIALKREIEERKLQLEEARLDLERERAEREASDAATVGEQIGSALAEIKGLLGNKGASEGGDEGVAHKPNQGDAPGA